MGTSTTAGAARLRAGLRPGVRLILIPLLLGVFLPLLWAAQAPITPQPLPGTGSSLVWQGPQFVQADKKGHVFVLRGDRFEVYPVTRKGELGEPERLKMGALTDVGQLLRAAMSPAGDEWIAYNGPGVPLLRFRSGKAEQLPDVGWFVDTVGWLRGSPVVNVVPVWYGPRASDFKQPSRPPLLLSPGSAKWSTLVAEELPADTRDPMIDGMTARGAVLVTDSENKLWMASKYRYRIRRFSPAGKVLLDLTLGDGKPVEASNPGQILMRFHGEARKQGMPVDRASGSGVMTAKLQIQAGAWGREGRLYLLVATAEGHALDRFDPALGALERVPLRLRQGRQFVSLAAGHDGLYLAGYRGTDGRLRIPWQELEEAEWKPLAGVSFDPPESGPPPAAKSGR